MAHGVDSSVVGIADPHTFELVKTICCIFSQLFADKYLLNCQIVCHIVPCNG